MYCMYSKIYNSGLTFDAYWRIRLWRLSWSNAEEWFRTAIIPSTSPIALYALGRLWLNNELYTNPSPCCGNSLLTMVSVSTYTTVCFVNMYPCVIRTWLKASFSTVELWVTNILKTFLHEQNCTSLPNVLYSDTTSFCSSDSSIFLFVMQFGTYFSICFDSGTLG